MRTRTKSKCLGAALCAAMISPALADNLPGHNYDESRVKPYTLPDLLRKSDGTYVCDLKGWNERRVEILTFFEDNVYGRSPGKHPGMKFLQRSSQPRALGGKAIRKEVSVLFDGTETGPRMELLIYLPRRARRPVPAFVALNFLGNHSITTEPGVALTQQWMRADKPGVVNNRATEAGRGTDKGAFPIEDMVARGYALVTAYHMDADPDFNDGFQNGVHPLFYRPGQTKPEPNEWGTLAAWSWSMSRAMDYLETQREIDVKRVAVLGHSRLGKASLWAGAQDQRFAIVISNNSGKGGASLRRRDFGESMKWMHGFAPHWFAQNYWKYLDNVDRLPVDQHMLIALIAPRPVYVASATNDLWADPRGEFLAAREAEPVYRLYRLPGLGTDTQPPANTPVGGFIGYHLREGEHNLTPYDWGRYMDFADRHFKR